MDERRYAALASPSRTPTERAFVVQFDPIHGARSPLRSRAEAVASGEAARFRSLKEPLGFMAGTLRKQVSATEVSAP